MATKSYTAIVEREGSGYVALCPELDVASQGDTVESATANLKEAVELFLECADPAEVERRLHTEVFVTRFEAANGVSFASSPDETSAASSNSMVFRWSVNAAATSSCNGDQSRAQSPSLYQTTLNSGLERCNRSFGKVESREPHSKANCPAGRLPDW